MEKFKKFIPLLVGVILIGAGIFMYFRAAGLEKACTEETTATVVSMREDIDTSVDEIRYIYYPVVSYEANNKTIEKQLSSGSNNPEYRIGDTLQILYNPENIEEFIVKGENQNIIWIILVSLGGVCIVAGIYVIVKKD